jgi:hypothetical protein
MICNINLNMAATRNGPKRLTPLVYQRARELMDSYGEQAGEEAQYRVALCRSAGELAARQFWCRVARAVDRLQGETVRIAARPGAQAAARLSPRDT